MDLGELDEHVAEDGRRDLKKLDIISRLEWQDSGYPSLWQVLVHAMKLTTTDAKRLARQVELVCPKVGFTGVPISEKLPAVRAAMAAGEFGAGQLNRIVKILDKIPEMFHEQADVELADAARKFGPAELNQIGRKLIDVLDPDGPEPADPTVVEAQNELDIRDHEDGSMSGRFMVGGRVTPTV